MLGKDLSQALGGISSEMVEEACACGNKRSRGRLWLRAAAVAATVAILLTALLWPRQDENGIVTAPGVLKVYAYEMKGETATDIAAMEDYELVEEPEFSHKSVWSPYLGVSGGISLTLMIAEESMQNAEITFDVTTNYGELYADYYSDKYGDGNTISQAKDAAFLDKRGQISNGETVYWEGMELWDLTDAQPDGGRNMGEVLAQIGSVYMDVVIKADGNIVGYALFEMVSMDDNSCIFSVALRNSVYYPAVDGEFQAVSEEYVRQEIEKTKQ